jgi:hypothetical protein
MALSLVGMGLAIACFIPFLSHDYDEPSSEDAKSIRYGRSLVFACVGLFWAILGAVIEYLV